MSRFKRKEPNRGTQTSTSNAISNSDYDIAVVTNDIYTREDVDFLLKHNALPADRILGVEFAGDKIPRKGGPGITKSDLLIINKIDIAE